ncbi:MAG: hypothetical protein ABR538_14900 [Candidatus Binatia bacterium]
MKTAVSVPDAVFEAAERLAGRLRMSRSQFYTEVLRSFVAQQRGQGVTERLNEVYGPDPSGSELDPGLAELQARALSSGVE